MLISAIRDILTGVRISALTLQLTSYGGRFAFWSDVDGREPGIWRLRERLFVGDATAFGSRRVGAGGAWLPSALSGANWGPRDSQFCVMHSRGGLAVTGMSRASDGDSLYPSRPATIGGAFFAIANARTNSSAWAGYFDIQFERGVYGYGQEIAIKNKGADRASTPYFPTTGTYGIWMNTGDDSYGGAAANPNNTGFALGRGSNGNTWNRGVVIFGDALTRDGFGRGRAISLGRYHHISWYDPGNHEAFYITSGVQTGGKGSAIIALDDAIYVFNGSGATMFKLKFLAGGKSTINGRWPTASDGLEAGDLWNNNGVLTVVA